MSSYVSQPGVHHNAHHRSDDSNIADGTTATSDANQLPDLVHLTPEDSLHRTDQEDLDLKGYESNNASHDKDKRKART